VALGVVTGPPPAADRPQGVSGPAPREQFALVESHPTEHRVAP